MIFLFIILALPLGLCVHLGLPCNNYQRSMKSNCAGCGVCQIDTNTHRSVCFYNQLDYFDEGKHCSPVLYCKSKRHLYSGECKGNECLSMLGTFKCQCDIDHFGRLCQFNRDKYSTFHDYAIVDDIIFTPIVYYSEYSTMTLILSNIGKDLTVKATTAFEYNTYDSDLCNEVSKDQHCKKWFNDYPALCKSNINIKDSIKCAFTLRFMFPATFSSDDYLIPKINGDKTSGTVGIKHKVTIKVYNNLREDTAVFENSYELVNMLKGPNLHGCGPIVTVRNAGANVWDALTFTIRDEIVITSSYQLTCNNIDEIMLHWTVWRILMNHDDLVTKPFREVKRDANLQFQAFSLLPVTYKIKLNISVWQGTRESFSYIYAYFKVVEMELLPVISGGAERTVYYDEKFLKLDGSLSRDPNLHPSKQKGSLKFYWKCDKPIPLCEEKHSDYNISYQGSFNENDIYTFYLTVVSTGRKRQATTSQTIIMMGSKQSSVEILCKKNCGGGDYESYPGKIVYLEAVIKSGSTEVQDDEKFDWTYTAIKENNYKPVDGIRQSNTPDNILIIHKNSLSAGEIYIFKVKGKSEHLGSAKFKVKMASNVSSFTCNPDISFENSTILRGVTKFKVVCDKLKYNKLAPIYDFYDMHIDDKGDNGRLIASGKSNIAFDIVLTRGKLVVEVTNEYGMTGVLEFIAKLEDTMNVTEIVQEELNNLKGNISTSDAEFKINTISIILDLVVTATYNVTDLSDSIEFMLKIASEEEISNIPILKMWTNLVNRIANQDLIGNLNTKSINYLSKAITKLSTKLLYEMREGMNEIEINDLTEDTVYRLSQTMLKICNAICNNSNKDIAKRRLREGDSYALHASYRESSDLLVRSVGRIMLSLAITALPHESPISMNEKCISIWVKEDTPASFSLSGNNSVTSVVIDKVLARSLSKISNMIIVQVAEYEENPYWYNREFVIHTHAVDLQIRFKKGDSIPFIEEIQHPVKINLQHFETVTRVVNGSVCQPYSNKSHDMVDLAIAIHKIRVPYTGRMNLKFLDLEEDHVIRIKVLFNKRPDYEYMTSKNVTEITKSSPILTTALRDPHSHDVYDLYYVGILPGINVLDGTCLNYSFEISALHCVTWKFHEWSTGGCKVNSVQSQQLQCECEHLSTFAGFSQVPINTIDPFADYKLFLNLVDNPFVFIVLVFLLLVYFILLIWALRKDRKENLKGGAVYLEDNFPRDPFSYLVAVYTGNKLFSGTTSNVGITIEGEEAGSRPHLLKSSSHRTLETGDDNWFIICTPYHLGDLIMIHLWIDYSGKSPEWYCHKVIIVDLTTSKEYFFLVDTWMSLKGDDFIERFVEVTKSHDDHRVNNAIDNLVLGFRETHLWVSVFARHPRSCVTRAQRLSLAFTGLLVTMLVSCMFYEVVEERKEDSPNFTLSTKELVVSVMGLIVSSTLINIVVSFFRRSLVLKQYDEEFMLEIEEEEEENNVVKKSKRSKKVKSKKRNTLHRFFEDVLKILTKPKKFKPVLLEIDKIKVNRRKRLCEFCWSLLSWSVCIIMICGCSYLIVSYSLRFGKVKSLEWLTSVMFSLLQIIFFVAPFRIISLATVSGILSSKMYEVTSYRVQPHHLEKRKLLQLNSDVNLDTKLISSRSQPFYLPLSYTEVTKKFYKQKRKMATWLLLDMVLILVLVVLIFVQNETLWSTKYYWNNKQLTSLLRQGYEEEGIQLYSLTNLSIYSLFLEKNVFPVIYRSIWYNGLPIIGQNITDDIRFVFGGTSKLFGLPRLRQLRLKPDLCEKPVFENLSQYCNVKLTEDTEDTNLYAEGWVETGPSEKFPELSPWNYMQDPESHDTTLFGYSNMAFKRHGYVAELDISEEKADDIVNTLHREKWLDRRTCVVILELTLYNGFTGTFSWLMSVTENLHIGLLTNNVYVFTVSDSYKFPIVDIVCFIGLLMFIIRVLFVVNRHGVDKLLHNFWNILEIIIVCLAVACAVLFMLNIYSSADYLNIFMTGEDREKYFQYLYLLKYLDEYRTVLLFLEIVLVCRFIMAFRFGRRFTIYFDCLVSDWNRITWIFIIFALFLYTHWRAFSYLMNNYTLSKNNFLIISKVDFKQIVENCSNVQCKISPFVLCSISYLVQLVIISYLVVTYRIVKRKLCEKQHLNFCTVFCEKDDLPIPMKATRRKSRALKLA